MRFFGSYSAKLPSNTEQPEGLNPKVAKLEATAAKIR
jgi:hypothetical protein